MKIERIRYDIFKNRMKTIEAKNIKKTGASLTWSSILMHFHTCILENQPDDGIIAIDRDKYNEIRKQMLK